MVATGCPGLQPIHAEGMQATVQEILDGPDTYIDSHQARVKEQASEPQEMSTRASRAQVRFSSGAAGRLNRNSRMRLGSSCFLLQAGQVLVSGRQNACTRSVRLSVRGTNYILEAFENGDAAVTSLQGSVEVEQLRDGEPSGRPAVVLNSGRRLRLLLALGMTTEIDLTPGDYKSLLEGPLFRGFRERLPDQGALEDYLNSNVPGVTLPRIEPPQRTGGIPGLNLILNLGIGGGGGPRPSRQERPRSPSTGEYPSYAQ
ncbi:MAG: iron dicitrate transport regulator FecR [Cyanobium sp.]